MFALAVAPLFLATFFVVHPTVLGEERNASLNGYFTALTKEVNNLLKNNPAFDTEQFKSLAADIAGAPFHLVLSKATVVEIKNVTYNVDEDVAFFTLGKSALRFKYVLTQISDRSSTEGNVTMVFSNIQERVKISIQKNEAGKLSGKVVEQHLFFPGSVKSVAASPPTNQVGTFALSIYNAGNNPVDIATEVTDDFEMYLNQAVSKVDVSEYLTL